MSYHIRLSPNKLNSGVCEGRGEQSPTRDNNVSKLCHVVCCVSGKHHLRTWNQARNQYCQTACHSSTREGSFIGNSCGRGRSSVVLSLVVEPCPSRPPRWGVLTFLSFADFQVLMISFGVSKGSGLIWAR